MREAGSEVSRGLYRARLLSWSCVCQGEKPDPDIFSRSLAAPFPAPPPLYSAGSLHQALLESFCDSLRLLETPALGVHFDTEGIERTIRTIGM